MIRAIGIAALLALAIGAPSARAGEPPARDGDVYLTYSNVDLRGKRFGTDLLWVQPVLARLDAHFGGHYAEFDGATWGYGILGAHAWLPIDLGHLTMRYEGGAGNGGDHYSHHIGDIGWTRPFLRDWFHLDAGLQLIRVDDVDEDLARVGIAVVPTKWLLLRGGYQNSLSSSTEVWTARGELTVKKSMLFAGYARSRDSLDLSSIGQGTVLQDPTDEVFVGTTLPFGRHGLTVSLSRFEGVDTRYTLNFTWRWSLATAPWSFEGEPEPPANGVPGRPGIPGTP